MVTLKCLIMEKLFFRKKKKKHRPLLEKLFVTLLVELLKE